MNSILIKDTTRQQREQIIKDSLGDDWDVGCGAEGYGVDYQLYIDGVKELRELNEEAKQNMTMIVAHPEERPSDSCGMGL